MQLARSIQSTAISVLEARHHAPVAPGREGGYTERELINKGIGLPDAQFSQLEPAEESETDSELESPPTAGG